VCVYSRGCLRVRKKRKSERKKEKERERRERGGRGREREIVPRAFVYHLSFKSHTGVQNSTNFKTYLDSF
jgi:hypothetical protein